MIVDEFAAITTLFLVVISLGDRFVHEEVVLSKLEDETEARLLKIFHADVGEELESDLVPIRDQLS